MKLLAFIFEQPSYENEYVMYKELRTLRGYFSSPMRLKIKISSH